MSKRKRFVLVMLLILFGVAIVLLGNKVISLQSWHIISKYKTFNTDMATVASFINAHEVISIGSYGKNGGEPPGNTADSPFYISYGAGAFGFTSGDEEIDRSILVAIEKVGCKIIAHHYDSILFYVRYQGTSVRRGIMYSPTGDPLVECDGEIKASRINEQWFYFEEFIEK